MPPKASRATASGHDDAESTKPTAAEKKNGHSHANGKMKRVASQNGSNLKDVQNAANMPSPAAEPSTGGPATNPSVSLRPLPKPTRMVPSKLDSALTPFSLLLQIQWATFDRDILHRYRREHKLETPTAYASDYRSWVLSQPGSIGLHSPTMVRKKENRRQTKMHLTNTVRKHFNSQGVQENDAIVEFVHRVRKGRLSKLNGLQCPEKKPSDHERI